MRWTLRRTPLLMALQDASGPPRRRLGENTCSIDEYMLDADRPKRGMIPIRPVFHDVGIKNHDIRKRAGPQRSAIRQTKDGSRQRGHFRYGLFKRQQPAAAHVIAKHARETPPQAG